jgi:exosortase/archaeosortase family protein
VTQPLVVAPECSGLRQMEAFLAIAALAGFLSNRSVVFQGLFLLMAVPASIAANVVRVLLMAVGVKLFGLGWLSGRLHDTPALFTVPLGMGLLFLGGWVLGRVGRPAREEVPS